MLDREHSDEFLRAPAADAGAERRTGTFVAIERDGDGLPAARDRDGEGQSRSAARHHALRADRALGRPRRAEWLEPAAGKGQGLRARLRRIGLGARAGLAFARLYLLPVKRDVAPESSRLQPVWWRARPGRARAMSSPRMAEDLTFLKAERRPFVHQGRV